jgi:hypothetical protein
MPIAIAQLDALLVDSRDEKSAEDSDDEPEIEIEAESPEEDASSRLNTVRRTPKP